MRRASASLSRHTSTEKEENHTPPARDRTYQELERLTLHSLSKIFDLFKKELLGVYGS
jgi:hypothetical protein